MNPFIFHILNEEGNVRHVVVVIASYALKMAHRDFGVDEVTEALRERGISFEQSVRGAPGITKPDIDRFVDENIHVFDNEPSAREFIRDWWAENS